jgi:NNP family nitrate/nitrite transporter-like MFS transporter
VVAALFAWLRMDDLEPVRASAADQAVVFVRPHTWLLAWLYLGSFGSFIGFAAGFPLVAEVEFAGSDLAGYAFLGPLLAAFARPAGGWLADRHGGARVALQAFVLMALIVLALLLAGSGADRTGGIASFLGLFALLFVASGIANGAVFQMIPAVFIGQARRAGRDDGNGAAGATREGTVEGAAALGLASGIGALGGFFIPKAYGTAIAMTGHTSAALVFFFVFYLSCIALTWWFYARPHAEAAC